LHEDHADLGGDFEDEFAVALGAAVIVEGDELVGDGASAAGETFGAGAEGLGMGSVALFARFADELVDGFEDPGCVLGDETDGFAIDEEGVLTDGGFDGKILLGRDAGELGELEEDRAEAVEEADEAVGMAAAESEVGATKGTPGWGEGEVEFFVADAAEELGVGGGAASGDSAEGAALAEKAAEVEDGARVGEDFWFVHRDSNASERARLGPLRLMRLLIIKELGGQNAKKRARNGPFAIPSTSEGCP
jgi:hypothetical protein